MEMPKEVIRKYELIQKLKKANLATYPSFETFDDGSGEINLETKNFYNFEYLVKLCSWCKKNKCTFQIYSHENTPTVPEGKMQLSIQPEY